MPVAFRSWMGTFLCADNGGEMQPRGWIGPWELFALQHTAGGTVIRAAWNGKHVSAGSRGGMHNVTNNGASEKFSIVVIKQGAKDKDQGHHPQDEAKGQDEAPAGEAEWNGRKIKVALKTAHGTYVSVTDAGKVTQTPALGPREEFTLLEDPVLTYQG